MIACASCMKKVEVEGEVHPCDQAGKCDVYCISVSSPCNTCKYPRLGCNTGCGLYKEWERRLQSAKNEHVVELIPRKEENKIKIVDGQVYWFISHNGVITDNVFNHVDKLCIEHIMMCNIFINLHFAIEAREKVLECFRNLTKDRYIPEYN